METFIAYLKSELKVILALVCAGLAFGLVFLFAELPMEYYVLGVNILFFGGVLYLIGQWFTYRKRLGLKRRLEELEQANQSLHNQLVEERKDLEAYFLLWIHQIKTPITVSNLLLLKDDAGRTEKLKAQMFYIEEYTNMAMNYLKLRDREADLDIAPVQLDTVIKTILKKYAMLFISKHIALNYEPIPHAVISDARWLSVLIEQIISNAIKYTEAGSISITYQADQQTLRIRDTGIGIRSEDMNKIFDRGYSGFNGRMNEKSSGLGLYLVRKISAVLNVEVQASSELNVGSTFSIVFKH